MLERLKEIPGLVLEWWNKFSSRQKTIIISVAAGIIVALAILVTVLTRPVYEVLVNCDSTKEASEIISLLEGDGIQYQTSEDGLQIRVLKEAKSQATLLLGANNIPTAGYDLSNVTSGGFSTTESDKTRSYKLYLESLMETDLKGLANVKSATVQLNLPDNDGTLISKQEESSAGIVITPNGEFNKEHAANVAQFVKAALGNSDVKKIIIMDNEGNLLFSDDANTSMYGTASSQMSIKQEAEAIIQEKVKRALIGTNEFNMVEVSTNLAMDFSTTKETSHTYTPAEGQTQGVLSHEDYYSSSAEGGSAAPPGTDSNGEDGTTYVIDNGGITSSSVEEYSKDYLPNETITETTTLPGGIQYNRSSISVAAIKYNILKEQDAKTQGLLDGISWEEYKLANSQRRRLEIDEDMISLVSTASGIPTNSITLVAYEEPMFVDKGPSNIQVMDVVQISVIVIILALLALVILRSMRSEKVVEEESELQLDDMLESTSEMELDEIEVETKSETRRIVEKFVDDNPESAANLLRNWLNEDFM